MSAFNITLGNVTSHNVCRLHCSSLSRSSFTRLCSHIRLQHQYLPSSRLDPPAPLNNSPVPLESLGAVWVCGSYQLHRERGVCQTRWDVEAWEHAERPACNNEITLKGRTYLCFVNVLLPLHPKVGLALRFRHPPNFYFFPCALPHSSFSQKALLTDITVRFFSV